jgi:hypothetical protein
MRKAVSFAGLILSVCLIVRAVAEPIAIDMTNPATYRNDWGGPSLIGVLAVHCGPGVLAGIAIVAAVIRRHRRSRPTPRSKVRQAT